MGMITRRDTVADALFSPVQQRVLGLLFGQPKRRFQSAELIRLVASGTGAVHRVLTRLTGADLVVVTRLGNQKYYQANENSPVCVDLCRLVDKTVGFAGPIANALRPYARKISAAFIYRAAGQKATMNTDVDLVVITDSVDPSHITKALESAETTLGRRVIPFIVSSDEWIKARDNPVSLVARIYRAPRLFIIGAEHSLS